ncbi:hypothetical protein DFH09DRAFT_1361582, partial [Mycena vulgaris]
LSSGATLSPIKAPRHPLTSLTSHPSQSIPNATSHSRIPRVRLPRSHSCGCANRRRHRGFGTDRPLRPRQLAVLLGFCSCVPWKNDASALLKRDYAAANHLQKN